MAATLRTGGRLILTSRNWELVRASGSRLEVTDRVIVRGRSPRARHAQLAARRTAGTRNTDCKWPSPSSTTSAEWPVLDRLDFWPFRHRELTDDLASAGLRVRTSTYADETDRYLVVAHRDP